MIEWLFNVIENLNVIQFMRLNVIYKFKRYSA